MTTPNLQGPFRLDFDTIGRAVAEKATGAFALGYESPDGAFRITYVGSSEDSLRARLLERIGSEQAFKFGPCASAEQAFLLECQLFHEFRPRANRFHPARPRGSTAQCPHCMALPLRDGRSVRG